MIDREIDYVFPASFNIEMFFINQMFLKSLKDFWVSIKLFKRE